MNSFHLTQFAKAKLVTMPTLLSDTQGFGSGFRMEPHQFGLLDPDPDPGGKNDPQK
jgi:hypothetical protein